MLLYSEVRDLLKLNYFDLIQEPVVFSPGPAENENMQKLSPQRIIFLTVGDGAGLTTESVYDTPFITVRVIGKQNDYDDAEQFANVVDRLLVGSFFDWPRTLGSTRVLYVTRSGGRPALVEKDSADRYHFTCSYVAESATGF